MIAKRPAVPDRSDKFACISEISAALESAARREMPNANLQFRDEPNGDGHEWRVILDAPTPHSATFALADPTRWRDEQGRTDIVRMIERAVKHVARKA